MRETTVATVLLMVLGSMSLGRDSEAQRSPVDGHFLMPVPAKVKFLAGRLKVDPSFRVGVDGYTDARLEAAVFRASRRLEGRMGFELSRLPVSDPSSAALVIRCKGPAKQVPALGEDESYQLEVSEQQAVLQAPTVIGVIRGLETFLQLLEADRTGFYLPAGSIQDQPRFKWRGLLIDAGRHFVPVEVVKRNLDGMAAVKLNVLHWHLTEDQGFRVESKRYPKLHQMGSDGLYYTQDQIREVIAYAADRGIRVMPEFDMPGHATSWLVGHPELGSAPGPYQIERKNGIFEPAFDPTREELYKFLEGFFSEMTGLFPDSFIHIGGDENEGHQWDRNPQIQEFMKAKGIKDNHGLQAYFNQRLSRIIQKLGKKMIGWDEILHPDLPKDSAIQSWRGTEALMEAARKGYDGLLSRGYYIDLMYPASSHYLNDPLPASSGLTEEQAAHILGGEATMWSEWVSPETIDSRIWPRTAAIAERLWSPREIRDVDDMYRRLDAVSLELEELGLTHKKNADMMLRRIARQNDISSLKVLASVIEPVKEYHRNEGGKATMLTPLTRLVDAVSADSRGSREFGLLVDGMLSDAPSLSRNRKVIGEILTSWRDASPSLTALVERSPILHEAEQLPKDLSDIGLAGLEALSYISAGQPPPPGWKEAKLSRLDEAARPKADVEFAVTGPVRKLVILAAEMQELVNVPHSDWKLRVQTLATQKQGQSVK
jgi:hexosaminidase